MTTTALIHDPLLFYPYSRTYYEAEGYHPGTECGGTTSGSTHHSPSSPSLPSSPSSSSTYSIPALPPIGCGEADWTRIMSSIKKAMYNSTSAAVPSPASYLGDNITFKPEPSKDPAFFYNSDILDVKDMYSYRQLRSENILCRMFNCSMYKVNVAHTSVMRLTKGVFIANKLAPSTSSPTVDLLDLLETTFSDGQTAVDTIDTFHSGDMKQFMLQQQQQQQLTINNHHQQFAPFSYTFGARYTNPYLGRDIVIRAGQLPLWCQTLFLNECMNQMPIKPDVPYSGLFPFAPAFTVIFRSSTTSSPPHSYSSPDYHPDLTFYYESYAMELSEPANIMDNGSGTQGMGQKQQVMDQMLFCDIAEESAEVLTQLANLWASDQSLLF